MSLNLTLHKLAQQKNPGKNRIRKIREKSRYKIPAIFEQILRNECLKYDFLAKHRSFLVIFTNFDIFKSEISKSILMNS